MSVNIYDASTDKLKQTAGNVNTELLNRLVVDVDKVKTDINSLSDEKANKDIISDAYDSSATYEVGDYCIYDNRLWKCLVQCENEAPSEGNYWTETNIGDELNKTNTYIEHSYFASGANIFVNCPISNGVGYINVYYDGRKREGTLVIITLVEGEIVNFLTAGGTGTVFPLIYNVTKSGDVITLFATHQQSWGGQGDILFTGK